MLFTAEERYRPTSVYRNLVETKTIVPTSSHEHFRYIPNHSKTSNTWDARHLDKFLDTNWGTKSPKVTVARGMTQPIPELTGKTESQKTGSLRPLKSQASHYFKNGPRFTSDREKAYLINFAKDFTIKETKNNVNTLVTNIGIDAGTLKKYCDKELSSLERTFDPAKLEFSKQEIIFASPEEKRRQLQEVKANQKEMAKWKERNKDLAKKYRVYKKGFKSGILGLDNPTNDETVLYKEEHQLLQKKKDNIARIEERRFNQLSEMTKSSSAVEFFNRNFDRTTSFPPRQIVSRNAKMPVEMEHTDRWKNSADRLFGDPEGRVSIDRAFKLRAEETKGRNWDIISSMDNSVMVKGVKSNL